MSRYCCIDCGDLNSTDLAFLDTLRPYELQDAVVVKRTGMEPEKQVKSIPRCFLAYTNRMGTLLATQKQAATVTIDLSEICQNHLHGVCPAGSRCQSIHICRSKYSSMIIESAPATVTKAAATIPQTNMSKKLGRMGANGVDEGVLNSMRGVAKDIAPLLTAVDLNSSSGVEILSVIFSMVVSQNAHVADKLPAGHNVAKAAPLPLKPSLAGQSTAIQFGKKNVSAVTAPNSNNAVRKVNADPLSQCMDLLNLFSPNSNSDVATSSPPAFPDFGDVENTSFENFTQFCALKSMGSNSAKTVELSDNSAFSQLVY